MKQKIALFVGSMGGGGAERTMLDIGRGLAQRGFVVDLVLLQSSGIYLADVPESVRVVALNTRGLLATHSALINYLRRQRPSVLLSTLSICNALALLARIQLRRSLPVIVRLAAHFSMDYKTSDRRGRMHLTMERVLWRFADAVVTNSNAVAVDLKRIVPWISPRVRVISNPVVWPDLPARAAEPVDHPWFRDGQAPVVLAAGRLHPNKDHATLLKAFALVASERTARLVIIGEGPERDRLLTLAGGLGITSKVQLPGFQRNPFAWMSRASVFVLSSVVEGAPNVLVQAMACGTTVVSTDSPGGSREILGNGAWGTLTPVGDHAALAGAISDAMDNPTPPGELKCRASDFAAKSSISAYEDTIAAVLNR
ncbi:MAG: glycosyltransferase [Gammaproteobacteria bacterium]|nr:glycosyltransferase [Gammaproteobacteria bacterium]